MSALWRINLWVCGFFTLVTLACMALLVHQALADVERELQSAEAVVHYLSETAERDPASLQPRLTQSLRHVRVRWLQPGETATAPVQDGLDAWLGQLLFAEARQRAHVLDMHDGRRVQIAVDPRDEIDEVWDSLQQLLGLCALALLLSLLTIRWAVRRGLGLLDDLLHALQQVSGGQLKVRLRAQGVPEARQLAVHFNQMTDALARLPLFHQQAQGFGQRQVLQDHRVQIADQRPEPLLQVFAIVFQFAHRARYDLGLIRYQR